MYDEQPILKSNKMAKIQNVSLEPAENGVILSWTEKTEKVGSKNTYDNCNYDYKKQVFDCADGAADPMESAFDAAMPEFKRLWKLQYSK